MLSIFSLPKFGKSLISLILNRGSWLVAGRLVAGRWSQVGVVVSGRGSWAVGCGCGCGPVAVCLWAGVGSEGIGSGFRWIVACGVEAMAMGCAEC